MYVPEVNLVFASGTDMSSERLSDEHEDKNVEGRTVVSWDPNNNPIDNNKVGREYHLEPGGKNWQLYDQVEIGRDQVKQSGKQHLDGEDGTNTKPKYIREDSKKRKRKPSEYAKRSRKSENNGFNRKECNNLKTGNNLVTDLAGIGNSVGQGANFAHHFDIFEKVDFPIRLDCVIPLCTSSRPFLFAHMFNLKPLSTPFDLVERCSLKKVISLFEDNFSDFFVDVKKVRSRFFSKTFVIRDLRNNLRSSFSFRKDFSFKLAKEGLDNLRDFYMNRMREGVNRSSSIGLVCDGHYPSRSLVNFVRRFGRIYPDKTIVLINIDVVRGIEGTLHISSPFASDKLKVVQFIVPERNVNKWDGIAYCIDAGQKRELRK